MGRIMIKIIASVIMLLLLSYSAVASAVQPAPLFEADENVSIKDKSGRTLYIVDLKENTELAFPEERSAKGRQRFPVRHSGKVQNMAESFEQQYGLEAIDMTSWVGLSLIAYINKNQMEWLRGDPRVERITAATLIEFSTLPPWSNNPATFDAAFDALVPLNAISPEVKPWGVQAVNGKSSTGGTVVYLLDAGVGYHSDLGNNITRVNPSCYNPDIGQYSFNCNLPVVGCYPHATAVAGIVAAQKANGVGVQGVNPGATIVSVAASAVAYGAQNGNQNCVLMASYSTTVLAGLDWIRSDIYTRNRWKPGIVNISMNGSFFASDTFKVKIRALAGGLIGGTIYAGALIVQSAGNYGDDACTRAYNEPSVNDGIMVVGAVDKQGLPDASMNGGAKSSFGRCVEVWAPGKDIITPWTGIALNNIDVDRSQSGNSVYNHYLRSDGTSWAAPHVAGVAAYLADTQNLTSAPTIEAAVRGLFYWLGTRDAGSYPVNMITLP